MRETLRRICELQTAYSSKNTPAMQERGRLIRQVLPAEILELHDSLIDALGPFGEDFLVEGSDGIGRKTELAWVRFCSKGMSPNATSGFYVVLHFSTDGSGVNIVVGCSSSKFHNGYSVLLPKDKLDERTDWLRRVVLEKFDTLEPFTDPNDFGASRPLPKSFQDASALVKKIAYEDIEDQVVTQNLLLAAKMLREVYSAQRQGREFQPADQTELEILSITRPTSNFAKSQGFGLTALERKAVELRAMALAGEWLQVHGYMLKDTSSNKPYDFEARRGEECFYVEVKGTTSDTAEAITMTHGEVNLHQTKKGETALIIVTGIQLTNDRDEPLAKGGQLESLVGWDIDEWTLKPTTFRVSRSPQS